MPFHYNQRRPLQNAVATRSGATPFGQVKQLPFATPSQADVARSRLNSLYQLPANAARFPGANNTPRQQPFLLNRSQAIFPGQNFTAQQLQPRGINLPQPQAAPSVFSRLNQLSPRQAIFPGRVQFRQDASQAVNPFEQTFANQTPRFPPGQSLDFTPASRQFLARPVDGPLPNSVLRRQPSIDFRGEDPAQAALPSDQVQLPSVDFRHFVDRFPPSPRGGSQREFTQQAAAQAAQELAALEADPVAALERMLGRGSGETAAASPAPGVFTQPVPQGVRLPSAGFVDDAGQVQALQPRAEDFQQPAIFQDRFGPDARRDQFGNVLTEADQANRAADQLRVDRLSGDLDSLTQRRDNILKFIRTSSNLTSPQARERLVRMQAELEAVNAAIEGARATINDAQASLGARREAENAERLARQANDAALQREQLAQTGQTERANIAADIQRLPRFGASQQYLDAEGNPVLIQRDQFGNLRETPGGFRLPPNLAQPFDATDLSSGQQALFAIDRNTGQPITLPGLAPAVQQARPGSLNQLQELAIQEAGRAYRRILDEEADRQEEGVPLLPEEREAIRVRADEEYQRVFQRIMGAQAPAAATDTADRVFARVDELVAQGVPEEEAVAQANREFGL